jgi:hypothetical protein
MISRKNNPLPSNHPIILKCLDSLVTYLNHISLIIILPNLRPLFNYKNTHILICLEKMILTLSIGKINKSNKLKKVLLILNIPLSLFMELLIEIPYIKPNLTQFILMFLLLILPINNNLTLRSLILWLFKIKINCLNPN